MFSNLATSHPGGLVISTDALHFQSVRMLDVFPPGTLGNPSVQKHAEKAGGAFQIAFSV